MVPVFRGTYMGDYTTCFSSQLTQSSILLPFSIRVSKLKVSPFGCSVQSVAIPPPPTQPPVTIPSPALLPDNLGSGDGNEEMETINI